MSVPEVLAPSCSRSACPATPGTCGQPLMQHGFSLLELLIVTLAAAVLAAMAWPQYADFIQRSKRADAKIVLMENSHYMERFLTANQRYDLSAHGNQPELPATAVPRDSAAAVNAYQIGFADLTAGTYTLIARPVNSMAQDACGSFTLSHTGRKGNSGNLLSSEDCWKR